LTDGDAVLLRSWACLNDSRLLCVDLDRFSACGFDYFREVTNRKAPSFPLLIPLQIVGSFGMVFTVAGNKNVVTDNLAISFENRS